MNHVSKKSKISKSKNRMKFHRQVNCIVSKEKQEISKFLSRIENQTTLSNHSNHSERSEDYLVQNHRSTSALRTWVCHHNVTRRAVNDLLKILKEYGMNWLPRDSRSLCKTPRSIEFLPVTNGQYWYHGIRTNLCQIFSSLDEDIVIQLNFNVDGIPLFKSSGTEFWPIMANIHSKCVYIQPSFSFYEYSDLQIFRKFVHS